MISSKSLNKKIYEYINSLTDENDENVHWDISETARTYFHCTEDAIEQQDINYIVGLAEYAMRLGEKLYHIQMVYPENELDWNAYIIASNEDQVFEFIKDHVQIHYIWLEHILDS